MSVQDPILDAAIANVGDHMKSVIQMLVDGVAFFETGILYRVFSHEGDELGTISTADLVYAIHYLKRSGREVGKCRNELGTRFNPGFSFAWKGWHSWA